MQVTSLLYLVGLAAFVSAAPAAEAFAEPEANAAAAAALPATFSCKLANPYCCTTLVAGVGAAELSSGCTPAKKYTPKSTHYLCGAKQGKQSCCGAVVLQQGYCELPAKTYLG